MQWHRVISYRISSYRYKSLTMTRVAIKCLPNNPTSQLVLIEIASVLFLYNHIVFSKLSRDISHDRLKSVSHTSFYKEYKAPVNICKNRVLCNTQWPHKHMPWQIGGWRETMCKGKPKQSTLHKSQVVGLSKYTKMWSSRCNLDHVTRCDNNAPTNHKHIYIYIDYAQWDGEYNSKQTYRKPWILIWTTPWNLMRFYNLINRYDNGRIA